VLFIINYDVPDSGEDYEKYSRKAFLFTKKQVVINIMGPGDSEKIKKIESFCSIKMLEAPLSEVRDFKEVGFGDDFL